MLQAAVAFVAWISVIRFFLNLDFFRTEDLSAAYEHHIPNEREKKSSFEWNFQVCGADASLHGATLQGNRLTIRRPCTKPWGWDKFLMQEYVVLDIFCFCCTMLPTREVGEKNQDHVRHNVRLDPSYSFWNRKNGVPETLNPIGSHLRQKYT